VQVLERQGSKREINGTVVHCNYYKGEGKTKTIRHYWLTSYSTDIGKRKQALVKKT
jgi:hypothetical protein